MTDVAPRPPAAAPDVAPETATTPDPSASAPPQSEMPATLQWADKFLVAALLFTGVYSLALLPFAPSLLGTHTVLSEFLRGSNASIVTAGALVKDHDAAPALVVLAGVVGLVKFDWMYWWGGARWGQWWIAALVNGKPRTGRMMSRIQAAMGRWGTPLVLFAYFLPIPTLFILVAAGWSGMSFRRFLLLDILGGLLWTCALAGIGYAIGHPAVHVAKEISHYGLALGVAIILVLIARAVISDRRSKAAAT